MSRTILMNRINDRYRRLLLEVVEEGPAQGVPEDFDNVILQLVFDEAAETTILVDTSNRAHTTAMGSSGGVKDTPTSPMGSNCMYKHNSGTKIHMEPDWTYYVVDGDTDYTIETYVYFIGAPGAGDRPIIGHYQEPINHGILLRVNAGELEYIVGNAAGTAAGAIMSNTWAPAGSTWYHVCVEKYGSTVTMYVDGEVLGTASEDFAALGFPAVSHGWEIGSYWNNAVPLYGYIDGMRATKEALYRGAFTPPTEFTTE